MIFIKILFSLGITQINLVFALTYNKIRCLTSSKALSGFPQMLRCFSTLRSIGRSTLRSYCWLYTVICHLVILSKNIIIIAIIISISSRFAVCVFCIFVLVVAYGTDKFPATHKKAGEQMKYKLSGDINLFR